MRILRTHRPSGLFHKNDIWCETRQKEPTPLVRVSRTTSQLVGNDTLFFYEKALVRPSSTNEQDK
ncbi:MAG: hypothetical protein ACJAWV_003751 [Flammeovirgaceae bacterium]|jgi:hypothetical protein